MATAGRWVWLLPLLVVACGGKAVVDPLGETASGGTGGSPSTSSGTGGGGTDLDPPTCIPTVDTPLDGQTVVEGPSPLDTTPQYWLLRGLHADQPEGQRFDVQHEGHLVAAEAVLFADDWSGDIIAEAYYVCDGAQQLAGSTRVPKTAFPEYSGNASELAVTPFDFDEPLPVAPGTLIDILFHPEGVSAVSAVHHDVYPAGEMMGLGSDLSYLGDMSVQIVVD